MASSTIKTFLLCFGVLVAAQLAMATSSIPAPTPSLSMADCLTVSLSLSDCLRFVEGDDPKPSSACCKEAAPVINHTPECICMVLFNKTLTSKFRFNINTTHALKLPTDCNITAPDPSGCTKYGYDVSGSPSPSPSPSLTQASSSASAAASTPSSSAEQTATPSSSNNKSASRAPPVYMSMYSGIALLYVIVASLAYL